MVACEQNSFFVLWGRVDPKWKNVPSNRCMTELVFLQSSQMSMSVRTTHASTHVQTHLVVSLAAVILATPKLDTTVTWDNVKSAISVTHMVLWIPAISVRYDESKHLKKIPQNSVEYCFISNSYLFKLTWL